MNENSIDGKARMFGGRVQAAAGDLTGDSALQMRGQAAQVAGAAQDAVGSTLDTAERWMDEISAMAKTRPLTTVACAVVVGYTLRALTHWRRG